MATDATNNAATAPEKEKEVKNESQADNGQTKDEKDAAGAGDKKEDTKSEASPKVSVHKVNFEKDVAYLYQFSRTPQLPSLSPYCLKVETWLRLAGIKYENVDHKTKYRSKKGQLPFIELNGEEIADSAFIIKGLSQKFNKDMDSALTAEQKNLAHAMISMVENHLSWVILWFRAKYPDNLLKGFKVNLQSALGTRVPNPLLNFCFKFSYGRKGLKKVKAQGLGVHSEEEILEFGKNDLRVLSEMLADKPFFFGNEPTTLDVVAFAFLAQIHFIDKEVPHPLRDYLNESCSNLVGLVTRIKERAFPDWEDICNPVELATSPPKSKDTKETKEGTEPSEKQPLKDDLDKDKIDDQDKETGKEADDKNENEK